MIAIFFNSQLFKITNVRWAKKDKIQSLSLAVIGVVDSFNEMKSAMLLKVKKPKKAWIVCSRLAIAMVIDMHCCVNAHGPLGPIFIAFELDLGRCLFAPWGFAADH